MSSSAATPLALLALLVRPALASDPSQPHPHRGVLTPITSAPRPVSLTADEAAALAQGKAVLRQQQGEAGGTGVAVQDVHAPADVVWSTILDYDRYDDWVDNVVSATIYRRQGDTFWLDMQMSILGIRSGMYTVNTLHRDAGWMSWTLDYDRKSDVDDIVGYWRVAAQQADPPLTRVEYATELAISGVPGFIVRYLTRDSLTEGTGWVKQRAEERAGE